MKENKYDDKEFFDQYSRMSRSIEGLQAAGEWHEFEKLLPELSGTHVLDLGCGYGWHCRYAVEHGADSVVGVDISERMLEEARRRTTDKRISYMRVAIEDIDFPPESFDLVISSLAFHYVESFEAVCKGLYAVLRAGGDLVFSVEHPVFTAYGNQDWVYDDSGNKLYWPVDRYFQEGRRDATFLGHTVIKYHRTLTTYVRSLTECGFLITKLVEPMPPQAMLDADERLREELRRPMMLLVAAHRA